MKSLRCPVCTEPLEQHPEMTDCATCGWPKDVDPELRERVESLLPARGYWDPTLAQRMQLEQLYQRLLRLTTGGADAEEPVIECTETLGEEDGCRSVETHGERYCELTDMVFELRIALLSPTIARGAEALTEWGDPEDCVRAIWTLAGRDHAWPGKLGALPPQEPIQVHWTFEYERDFFTNPGQSIKKLTREERDFLLRLWDVPFFEPGTDEWHEGRGLASCELDEAPENDG